MSEGNSKSPLFEKIFAADLVCEVFFAGSHGAALTFLMRMWISRNGDILPPLQLAPCNLPHSGRAVISLPCRQTETCLHTVTGS